jgi:hypothetical protein
MSRSLETAGYSPDDWAAVKDHRMKMQAKMPMPSNQIAQRKRRSIQTEKDRFQLCSCPGPFGGFYIAFGSGDSGRLQTAQIAA